MHCKTTFFLVIDTTLASDNLLRLRNNLLEKKEKQIMRIVDRIRDEKLQYDNNREAANISPLSSGKINEHEYLTGEKILPSSQS